MKKKIVNIILLVVAVTLVIVSVNSCGSRKTDVTKDVDDVGAQDTLTVLELASSCMDALKEGRIEAALEMMYVVRNDTLMPVSDEQKVDMTRQFKFFPVLDYTLESFSFSRHDGNEVKFRLKFVEESEADNRPAAYTNLKFCPVKYNADWYLAIECK